MTDSNLPGGREFFNRFSVVFGLAGTLAAGIVLVYLAALLPLPPHQARALWWMVGAVAVGITPVCLVIQNRMMRDLVLCLDDLARGDASKEQIRRGFAIAVDLPRGCAVFGASNFSVGSVLLVAGMWLVFDDFRLHSSVLIVAAAVSGGVLAGLIQFFVCKQALEAVREDLAARLPDPAERELLVRHVPLVRKISIVLITVALVPVVFSVFLAYSRAGTSAVALAQRLHGALLERAAEWIAADPEQDVDLLLARLQQDADGWGIPAKLDRVDDGSETLSPAEYAWIEAQVDQHTHGDTEPLHGANVVTWQRFGDPSRAGTVTLAVVSPRDALWNGDGLAFLFALVVAIATGVALVVAWLLARDVGRAARSLEEQAAQVAGGDLSLGHVLESEDELGRLGRSFSSMASALRSTVARVVETANRVEETGVQICGSAEQVTAGTRARTESTQGCVRAMTSVNDQALAVHEAASALTLLAEESSSSVLEMGAAGEEMKETATVLSDKVDQVSTAIEQSLRSIGHVRDNTGALAVAAEETSSSMEEMAAAMRQVDATAEETASLAAAVIAAAETGQGKVRETVRGMDSIREATDSAQGVINALGARVLEIDAVLEVIHDIANRTNLLALNASIIAAQAGEHGRPFAVVAGEISELAIRVRSSSDEIGKLIRSVQDESENAVGAIEAGTESVSSGVKLANEAGASLDAITASARKSGERSREIVVAVREQSRAAAHVVDMMERVAEGLGAIRGATEEQTRGHESVASGTRKMREVAMQLRATTEEQSRGVRQIGESTEGVRTASASIQALIESQTAACETSSGLLERLAAQASLSEESVLEMEQAIRGLVGDSETLRHDVEHFKT